MFEIVVVILRLVYYSIRDKENAVFQGERVRIGHLQAKLRRIGNAQRTNRNLPTSTSKRQQCSLLYIDFDMNMLLIIPIGDEGHLMTPRIALLVVDQRMHIVVLQKLLRTAFPRDIVLFPMGVVLERNGDTLVCLELLCIIEEKLEGSCIRDDFSDLIRFLEGGDQLQDPTMRAIEMRDVIIGGGEEQPSLLEVELDLWGELFILS